MLKFLDFDPALAEACAAEFLAAPEGRALFPEPPATRPAFLRIDNAADGALPRFVLKMDLGGRLFVLKLNLAAAGVGGLAQEYHALRRLRAALQDSPGLGVVQPLYLSPGGTFMVTDFNDEDTAWTRLTSGEDPAPVYTLAGRWLAALHDQAPADEAPFWPKWIFTKLDAVQASGTAQARPQAFRPMMRALRQQAEGLRGRVSRRCLCHGDFHPGNLLIGPAGARGLDLSEEQRKLAVYDMVDFLKADVKCDGPDAQVGAGGVLAPSRAAFLDGYGQEIDAELLDFCLRARLLITWIGIDRDRYARSDFQRDKWARLERRLSLAFDRS
ncbi:phosphotransferase family protein [Oceanicola sp. S124]|uniref:phosphotransferase family protein n=1 Tax=Oceanicola sp. S124 TaxID=1042378 RepID=UPI00025590E6|nr:phosphotransferase [Oceanicola sp. S124]